MEPRAAGEHSPRKETHKYDVGDYVVDANAGQPIVGRIVERFDTLPEVTYKVDFPNSRFYKKRSESQLLPDTNMQLVWSQINNACDLSSLPGHQGIRSGAFCEAILQTGISFAEEAQGVLRRIAEKHLRISEEVCKKAIDLYCCNGEERIIAHYRHPHSDPEDIFQFGALLRLARNNAGRKILILQYESRDRVVYGNRPQVVEFTGLKDTIKEVRFLGSKLWYTNFMHPDAYDKLPRFDYRGPTGDFVSWKEKAGPRLT